MIDLALEYTRNCLNQGLVNQFSSNEKMVVLNNLVSEDGQLEQSNLNKVVISLINLDKESMKPYNDRYSQSESGNWKNNSPALRLNLDMLVTSVFTDYTESLKFLNAVITFFQTFPTLNANNFASIPAGLDKLEFEVEKIDYFNMLSLWNSLGAKYKPSVIYKVRMIVIQGDQLLANIAGISELDESITPNSSQN